MSDYIIFTDSGCDIAVPAVTEMGARHLNLKFSFEGENVSHTVEDVDHKEFYDSMRAGRVARTAALNIGDFRAAFSEELEKGNDVFYLAFSSGLSSTFSSALAAAEELMEEYPQRRVIAVDSLSASAGHGLLLYLAVRKKNEGASIDELKEYCEGIRLNVCHWFTVDDLVYLKRGGRVSAATALAGTVLGIKPILHVDDEGHLINMSKVRGRKAAIKALADKLGETRDPKIDGTVFISHADCQEDAETLAKILKEQYGVKADLITNIGPVIGAHSGPGTLALFFLGNQR